MSIFKDKFSMSRDASMKMAPPDNPLPPLGLDGPDTTIGTSMTLREFHDTRRAGDEMSVRNLSRPRRGHDY